MKKIITTLLLITLISSVVYSDTIIMKNGDSLKGKVIFQNKKIVKIKTQFGDVQVSKIKIKLIKISIAKKPKETVYIKLKTNTKICGTIIKQNDKEMILSYNKNIITISKANIAQLSWEPIKDKKEIVYLKKSIRWDSIWRSALLPSWGQFYDDKKAKGIIIATVMGLLAITTVISQIDYNSQLNDYLNNPTDSLFNSAENARKRTNNLIIGLSIGWVLNIADAALFSSHDTKKLSINSGLRSPKFAMGGYGLEFFKRF